MSQALWTPSSQHVAQSNITRFMRFIETEYEVHISNYSELYDWSINQREDFWTSVWRFCGVNSSKPWDEALSQGDQMPGATWFAGAELNFAQNLLSRRDDQPAIVFRAENKQQRSLSYAELYGQVARVATALRASGVGVGDRVAGFMPNIHETVVAMLATTSLGAIWSSCSPDFGTEGAVERFGQIEPKILFCPDGYFFKGKRIDSLQRVAEISERIASIEKIVVVNYTQGLTDLAVLNRGIELGEFIEDFNDDEIQFEQLPFNHPLYILYSSGTTGLPKCIVHGAGGTLLQHLKEHVLHTNLKAKDRLFYFTTCGWMMWNWLVSGLASGATLVLYDGSPFYPSPAVLWDFAQDENIKVFGASAKYFSALEKANVKPGSCHDLSSLECILSTGSPLLPESFDYVYRDIKSDVQLSSISGGTDIVSCFALGCPIVPVYRGELQCRGLGMDVRIYNDEGQVVEEEYGELVCRKSAPSMPLYFWNDKEGSRYKQAYFSRFPGVWTHGDYAMLNNHGGMVITGRSDAILNPGGVRIGTAEIYRHVEKLPSILESIAVGQEWRGDVRIILFVKLRDGQCLDKDLVDEIKNIIRRNETPRHVPAKVIQIADIPRTISGKLVELAVRNVIHHRPVLNLDALANPEALDLYKDLDELKN